MRIALAPHLLMAAAVALAAAGCTHPPPPDPVEERLSEIADPDAARVVARMLEAYGGLAAWSDHDSVEYVHRLEFYGRGKTPEKVTRQIHRFSIGVPVQAHLEDLDGDTPQVIHLEEDVLEVTRGGLEVLDPAELEFPRMWSAYARFVFLQPWNMLEAGSSLEIRSPRTPPRAGRTTPDPCDVVRLTRKGADGAPPGDWSDFYISQVSRLVDRVHSYRAEDGTYRVTAWSDHRTTGGVRIPTRRATYASDVIGVVGPLELVVEYADIRFDVPVLKPSAAARAGGS